MSIINYLKENIGNFSSEYDSIEYKNKEDIKFLYHVTNSKNIRSIKKNGLLPNKNSEMNDAYGVYMFKNKNDLEDALANWLGDKFYDENEEDNIIILTIDPKKINSILYSEVDYEVYTKESILPEAIIKIQTEEEFFNY